MRSAQRIWRLRCRLGVVFALLFFAAVPVGAQIEPEDFPDFLAEAGANYACFYSTAASETERDLRNTLVWVTNTNIANALVYNGDVTPGAPGIGPCRYFEGRCAIFEGDLPLAAGSCEGAAGYQDLSLGAASALRDAALVDPTVASTGVFLMELVAGLTPADAIVARFDAHPVYMSINSDGTRNVRIEQPGRTVRIASLRIDLNAVAPSALDRMIDHLGSGPLSIIGPNGGVHSDGRMALGDVCATLVSPTEMQARLAAANAVMQLETVPTSADDIRVAYLDLVQVLLGGEVVHGPPLTFSVDQDPRLFLYSDEGSQPC